MEAEGFNPDSNYTHFALNKNTNKIVNGWNYSDIDAEDIRLHKYDYFTTDLIDYDLDPKEYKIWTKAKCEREGIDPQDWNNWSQN